VAIDANLLVAAEITVLNISGGANNRYRQCMMLAVWDSFSSNEELQKSLESLC
jgi:hypothetical protein